MATPKTATQAASGLISATVYRGTVHTEEGMKGPGELAQVTQADFNRLADLGFFRKDGAIEPEEVQDGSLKVTADTGPNVVVGQ